MNSKTITRIIGIDFGTSTSVVCYKDYDANDQPLDEADARPIYFGENHSTIPTLVLTDPNGNTSFGYEAERKAVTCPDLLQKEFKMDLGNKDSQIADQAKIAMRKFLEHLYEMYRRQATTRVDASVEEHTFISYPVKWLDPVRQATIEAASKAGFPQVKGMDEPSAAMRYFLRVRSAHIRDQVERLFQQGILRDSVPIYVLVIDMGAGTSDFVLLRYVPGKNRHQVLATWPSDVRATQGENFGGREIDQLLWQRFVEPIANAIKEKFNLTNSWILQTKFNCKVWKEETVSPELRDNQRVENVPGDLMPLCMSAGVSPKIALDRACFETQLASLLQLFPQLIDELIAHAVKLGAIKRGADIGLVVLTGGHSQWYFVKEVLEGRLAPGERAVNLDKIKQEPIRILQSPLPQETVARGLVMSGLSGMNIVPVAANNVWLTICIGKTEIPPFLVCQAGDLLPREQKVFYTSSFAYEAGEDIDHVCTFFSGEDLSDENGKSFPFDFTIELGFWTQLGDVLASIFDPDWVTEKKNRADFYLEIAVDRDEKFFVKGLVNIPWRKQFLYFPINRPQLNTQECEALSKAYKVEKEARVSEPK